jgi:hypothetical protein
MTGEKTLPHDFVAGLAQTHADRHITEVMKRLLLGCSILLSLLTGACGLSGEQAEIAATLEETINALETGDLAKLWDVSAPEAREKLVTLHTQIRRAMETIDVIYPQEERRVARASIGADFMGSIPLDGENRGARLLAAFIKPEELRMDQAARDGLRNKGAQIDGDRATIQTSAGEVFTFQRTTEGWRSALVMDILERNSAFRTIEENVSTVLKAAEGKRRAWVESLDPTTPNGAFNLMQQTLAKKPIDTETFFTLLDGPTRKLFTQALLTSRDIQKRLQKRVPRPKRQALYAKYGIANLTRLKTDLELFQQWCNSESFSKPVLPTGEPSHVKGDIQSGQISLITSAGNAMKLIREDDGYWHVTSEKDRLTKAILGPLNEARARLNP